MGTRFHQLGLNTFNAIIPRDFPSNADRDRFLEPEIGSKRMLEHAIARCEGFKKATSDNCPAIYQLEVAPGEPSRGEWFPDEPFPPPKECGGPSSGQPLADPSSSKSVSRPSSSPDPVLAASDTVSAPSGRKSLVGRLHFAADTLIGRCTTGYYAYDVPDADETNWRVCFLKDSYGLRRGC